MRIIGTFVFVLLIASLRAEILPGHSYHGEAFNEGPRQAAYLMGDTGPIDFEVTTTSEKARKFFNQGVGQLHGFWYFEAERSFRQAATHDPGCAMAYWGMAMANGNTKKRGREFIAQAQELAESATKRERSYIAALEKYYRDDKRKDKERKGDFAADLKKVMDDHPEDIEAKAFYAVQLWKNNRTIKIKDRKVPNKILNEVLAKQPLHPAHHYRIHLWDVTPGATNALNSAAHAGTAAPAIAHMWHMPGHTYSRLKRYSDGAWQQEASARTDHAYMIKNRVMPDQIHNFAHNNEWLIRNLNHLGAVDRAIDLARNMIELPRHPNYNTFKKGSANYGTMRLLETVVRYELWDELIRLSGTQYLAPTDNNDHEVRRHHALGLAYAWQGDAKGAARQLAALDKLKAKRPKPKKPAAKAKPDSKAKPAPKAKPDSKSKVAAKTTPEPKTKAQADSKGEAKAKPDTKAKPTASPKGKSKGKRPPRVGFLATLSTIEVAQAEINATRFAAVGDAKTAKTWLAKAAKAPPERLSAIYAALGDSKKALELAATAAKKNNRDLYPVANQIRTLWQFGETDKAIAEFKKFRPLTAETDLKAPLFDSLGPVAKQAGFKADWRPALKRPADFGKRPDLGSLGPFRWTPPPAKEWSLPDEKGKLVSLQDQAGRATIVIFYLGAGCTHCIEQLAAFAPLTKDFDKLGISLVGISTDSKSGLRKSAEKASAEGGFPFPLVADPALNVFKRYRAYDDFEKIPLHGTFLISPKGNILWQDISYEPFVKTDYLLKESKRLLGLDNRQSIARATK
jgi:peroxiredoxin